MRDITIKQARAFILVAKHGAFARAAKELSQSQPALTRCIQEMESALGQGVFTRSNHGVRMSPFGKAFLPHARKLIEVYDETLAEASGWRNGWSSELRLSGCSDVMHQVLPELLRRLRRELEQPKLQFTDASNSQVLNSVSEGETNFGVCIPSAAAPELEIEPLLESPLGLLTPLHFRLPAKINSLYDLRHVPIARFADDSAISRLLIEDGVKFDAYFGSRIQCCSSRSALTVARSEKIVMVATGFDATQPQAADLQFVPLPGLLPNCRIALINRRDSNNDDHHEVMKGLVRRSILDTHWHSSVVRFQAAGFRMADRAGEAANSIAQ